MKNHAVNNEYVQNLVEGLLNEECSQPLSIYESKARMRRQLKSKHISPAEKAAIRKKLDVKEEDSEGRLEDTRAAINTQAAEDGGYGVASDIEHGRWEPDIKDEGGSRQPPKVPGAKTPRPFKNAAGRILKKKVVEEGIGKDLVGAATGPTATNIYKKVGRGLRGAGEVVSDFVRGGAREAAPGLKDKFGNLVRSGAEAGSGLVQRGLKAANDWSKTPDRPQGDSSEGTEPKSLPAPKK